MKYLRNEYSKYSAKIQKILDYKWKDLTFENIVRVLYRPTDPASLGVCRMLFGWMMVLDGPEERGGAEMDLRWGDPMGCHFPLIPLKVLPLPYMALAYAVMWFGALGIALGYKFRISTLMFAIPYWYLFLLEKSYWNNHSYLFGLVAILLIGTEANNYCSLDAYFDRGRNNKKVPYWNYFILKFQFFILYFMAGLKKSGKEWLSGYAMSNLNTHWMFSPFKIFLTEEQTDYLVVHWFAFVFDLTIGFWMIIEYTRPVAMVFCATFHLMNSRLFSIGMFPWVCLATMPLFCPPDWPRKISKWKTYDTKDTKNANINDDATYRDCNAKDTGDGHDKQIENCENDFENTEIAEEKVDNLHDFGTNGTILSTVQIKAEAEKGSEVNWKQKVVVSLLMTHIGLQVFLPYSHFITKGYNNWTNGLYGYSWDMMVHNWDTILVLTKVVDNESQNEVFLDPKAWTPNDRWSKHGDMVYQYAQCLRRNLMMHLDEKSKSIQKSENMLDLAYDDYDSFHKDPEIRSSNISIYIDVWCSMNGRFQQRMFDPNYDLLKAKWSPFEKVEWLMPLLTEFSDLRELIVEIQDDVYAWNNYSEALFIADFPGMHLENYITSDLYNVTLTILEGQVFYEVRKKFKHKAIRPEKSMAVHLIEGEKHVIKTGTFHRIYTVGDRPACYVYTFMNSTKKNMEENVDKENENIENEIQKLSFFHEFSSRMKNVVTFWQHVGNALLHLIYGVPMIRRVEL